MDLNPDPGGPKTYGSGFGSGSKTLAQMPLSILVQYFFRALINWPFESAGCWIRWWLLISTYKKSAKTVVPFCGSPWILALLMQSLERWAWAWYLVKHCVLYLNTMHTYRYQSKLSKPCCYLLLSFNLIRKVVSAFCSWSCIFLSFSILVSCLISSLWPCNWKLLVLWLIFTYFLFLMSCFLQYKFSNTLIYLSVPASSTLPIILLYCFLQPIMILLSLKLLPWSFYFCGSAYEHSVILKLFPVSFCFCNSSYSFSSSQPFWYIKINWLLQFSWSFCPCHCLVTLVVILFL